MQPTFAAGLVIILLVALLIVILRQKSKLLCKETDLSPILNELRAAKECHIQIDRSVRDEISRNRSEQSSQSQALRGEVIAALTGIGDSVSVKVESLTRSNDQKFELSRSGMEQRLDSISGESTRKMDLLIQSASTSGARLEEEVSRKLVEFRSSLDTTVKDAHQLQREQTERLAGAIQLFQTTVEERQGRLQTAIDSKLSVVNQIMAEKLSSVEAALRVHAQQLTAETAVSFKNLGDSILATLTGISQLQKTELQDLKMTVDSRLATIQVENEKKLEQMRQTVDEKLQGTLEARLGESFKQVSDRLEQVYKGLGEMQTLAAGVGDLKRVLTNVKTRGTWGEVQLGALLEQMLAPGQ